MDESDYSENEDQQLPKKESKKDKKDKKKDKDKGYAHLEGESSPEEEIETSISKSKKSKTFKFTSSKSKDKSEKRKDKDKREPKREKENKCKEPKDKKEREEKKNVIDYQIGNIQPVFGVSVNLSTDFSRCHDGIDIPLVVRNCIDYLQEHALRSEQIYKVEPVKGRLQTFKKSYNNHECRNADEFDIPTACGLLKLFLKELPEPILTTDLTAQFEEASAKSDTKKQEELLFHLIQLLPQYNRTLLAWIFLHFESVMQYEKHNKMNAQSLAMLLSPVLQMSHRLMMCLLFHSSKLFNGVTLIRYIPPLTSSSPKLPNGINDINIELRKQESLLSQIHAEMNAGFISKKREEQLWEVQRIITQLKRKLKSYEKKSEKYPEDNIDGENNQQPSSSSSVTTSAISHDIISSTNLKQTKYSISDDESTRAGAMESSLNSETKLSPDSDYQLGTNIENFIEIKIHESGIMLLPESHPEFRTMIRLQLENEEFLAWKNSLKKKINIERAETLKLKNFLNNSDEEQCKSNIYQFPNEESDNLRVIEHFIKENALLENKKNMLVNEIFEETRELLQLQVELKIRTFNIQ